MYGNFNVEQFRSLLGDNSFLKQIQYNETTASTQIEAKQFVKKCGIVNALFIADRQTEGRGRLGRSWYDTSYRSLIFSILTRPKIPLCKVPLINLAAGMSVKKLLALYDIDSELKWPNDIMVSGKKLCGILSESATVCDSLFFVITGVGINVNSDICDFPSEISDIATSLKILTGNDFSREKLLADFLPVFVEYITLIENNAELFLETYRTNCDTLGKIVKVTTDGFEFSGIAVNINSDGAILIKNKNGEKQSFFAADVMHLRTV